MKKLVLCAFVLGAYVMPLSAAEVDTDHLMHPEDVNEALAFAGQQDAVNLQIADASDSMAVNEEQRKNAIQRNFTSRRAYRNRNVQDKNEYGENEEWIGATQKIGEERKLEQVERLNRRFISRRSYRH